MIGEEGRRCQSKKALSEPGRRHQGRGDSGARRRCQSRKALLGKESVKGVAKARKALPQPEGVAIAAKRCSGGKALIGKECFIRAGRLYSIRAGGHRQSNKALKEHIFVRAGGRRASRKAMSEQEDVVRVGRRCQSRRALWGQGNREDVTYIALAFCSP